MSEDGVVRVGTAGYRQLFSLSYGAFNKYVDKFRRDHWETYSFPGSFQEDVRTHVFITPMDVFIVVILAVLWTKLRLYLTFHYFLPIGNSLRLTAKNTAKFPESVWKLGFYTCTFIWSFYTLILAQRYTTFYDPLHAWEEWTLDMLIPWDIYITYAVQASFYLHSVYATLFLDVWRRDSLIMLLHHFLTLALIAWSFGVKQHMIGALVLLLHDLTDVQLEFTKLNTYLKYRNGSFHSINESLANIGFACFAVSWFVLRLYWFPLKVLYAALYGAVEIGGAPDIPFVPIFAALLWLLFFMNIYWFQFILLLLYRVGTGQTAEVEDVREDGEIIPPLIAGEKRGGQEANGTTNGHAKSQ